MPEDVHGGDYRNDPNGAVLSGIHALMLEPAGLVEVTAEPTSLTFEEFFRAHYARLATALLLLTGRRSEAEELAQEAMVRVFERWDRVRGMDSPDGYAYRTALNLHRKRLRRAAVWSRLRLGAPSEAPDPAAIVGPRQEVLALLRSLPREQREALVLVEWLGFSAEEAGRVLGIAAASVRGRLHRARAAVRKRFGGGDE
jgi:RNA polymerase sigma factor (sigma-70 family)